MLSREPDEIKSISLRYTSDELEETLQSLDGNQLQEDHSQFTDFSRRLHVELSIDPTDFGDRNTIHGDYFHKLKNCEEIKMEFLYWYLRWRCEDVAYPKYLSEIMAHLTTTLVHLDLEYIGELNGAINSIEGNGPREKKIQIIISRKMVNGS